MVYPLITLYSAEETKFETNGLGSLGEASSCKVIEEGNGQFELEMVYPVHGRRFNDLLLRNIIYTKPNPIDPPQGFRIYEISKPMNGMVTVNAAHLRYDLSGYPVSGFESSSCAGALAQLKGHSIIEHNFEFWTDKETNGEFFIDNPITTTAALGGSEGSILDVYGGEYKFDNFLVRLYNHRGADRGVVIRYGKNLTDFKQEESCSEVYTHVLPYYESEDALVTLTDYVIPLEGTYHFTNVLIVDLSSEFEEPPYEDELLEVAQDYIKTMDVGKPKVNLTVSFAQLEQSDEYKDIARLERVELFDTVTVEFPEMNVSATAKVNKTEYNPLTGRYNSITLGSVKAGISDTVISQGESLQTEMDSTKSFLEQAVERATKWITNGRGYMVAVKDEAGNWMEICSLDTQDINTAMNVWRWNNGGFGHSSNGYDGPYTTAITQEGEIVADFITTGILRANLIQAGILSSKDGETFYLDIENSILKMRATELTITGKTIPEIVDEAAQGFTSFIISLNNEYQGVPVDSNGNYDGSLSITTRVQALFGSVDVTLQCEITATPSSGVTGVWSSSSRTYTVTQLTTDEGYVDITAVYTPPGEEKSVRGTKRFTVKKTRDGAQGQTARTYYVELSATALKRTGTGVVPSSLTAHAYYRDGTSTSRTPYSGRIRFQTSTNGTSFTTVSTSSYDENSRTYSLANLAVSIVSIRVILYAAGGTTNTLDMVTVPIVIDASSLSQKEIFDILTNGGQTQGIYLQNNKVYINGEYIGTGTIASRDGSSYWNLDTGVFHTQESSNEWLEMYESIIIGGHGSVTDGLLDLSGRYTTGVYDAVLEGKTGYARLKGAKGVMLERPAYINQAGTHIVGSYSSDYGSAILGLYITYNNGSYYIGHTPESGSVLFTITTSSDAKLKKDIWEADVRALDVINAIGHCQFDFKLGGHRDCGYIAQQLQEVRQEFVIAAPFIEENGEESETEFTLQINDHEILTYATKAIQELSEENDILKQRCSDLEQRVEKLEGLVSKLVHSMN